MVERKGKIVAFAGGKGGVGKSLIAANVAICLAKMGHRVITLDFDFGSANLHTHLGIEPPKLCLSDFLCGKVGELKNAVSFTGIENLYIISGAQDQLEVSNLSEDDRNRLIFGLRGLEADFVIVDLGAGNSFNILDIFVKADQKVLVITPEPTSIENTHRFVKSAFVRSFKLARKLVEMGPIIKDIFNSKLGIKSPAQLMKNIMDSDPIVGALLQEEMSGFHPLLITNQIRTDADRQIATHIETIYKHYLGIDVSAVGYLQYDTTVWQSVRKKKSVLLEFPGSDFSFRIKEIARNIARAA